MKTLAQIVGNVEDCQVTHTFSCKHDSFGAANFEKIYDFSDCTLKDLLSLAKSTVTINVQNSHLRKADKASWEAAKNNSGTLGVEGKVINVAEAFSPKARLNQLDAAKKAAEEARNEAAASKLFTDTLVRLLGEGKDLKAAQEQAKKLTVRNYPSFKG